MSVKVSGTTVFQWETPRPLFTPKGLVSQPSDYFYWDASNLANKRLATAPTLWPFHPSDLNNADATQLLGELSV